MVVVGHRFVHGGGKFADTVMIDDAVLKQLEQLSVVDAEHTPVAMRIVRYFSQIFPGAMQVACFDTVFFKDLPEIVTKLPIPKKFYEKGIRKYGFHGLSYSYVLDEFTRVCGERAARGRVIVAHLGGGSSLAAIVDGKPVDTTMSYTPCSGIVMSSRSGDIDPGIYWHMIANENMSNDETFAMFNNQSGLMGVSGTTGDMELLLVEENNNEDAKAAVELFCYRIKQTIGSYAAVMGGVDSIIFCGGIGERSSVIRQRILEGLEYLGVIIDKDRNSRHLERISDNTSRVGVHVIHTDESCSILREVVMKMNSNGKRG